MAENGRYSSATRLHRLKQILLARHELCAAEAAEELKVSVKTARRLLDSLGDAGEPVDYETRDRVKYYRLVKRGASTTVRLTLGQAIALLLSRRTFDFLKGTGFQEELESVFEELASSLRKHDAKLVKNLESKIFDRNEHPHIYTDRDEHVDDLVTSLVHQQTLDCIHASVGKGKIRFAFEPYTLMVFRKGLYVIGRMVERDTIRTLALDGFREIERVAARRFDYPKGYSPKDRYAGCFGLFEGIPTKVVVRFRKSVLGSLERRWWHESQIIEPDGEFHVRYTMHVAPTVDVETWVLGFGDTAEVLEPPELREKVVQQVRRMAEKYGIVPSREK